MTPAGARIAAAIAAQGPIPLAQFMTVALLDPQCGYYATRDPFGAAGDFVTAPQVSQMFGELVGLWLAQAWLDQGKPARPLLVELGPGRGTLMADALRAMAVVADFRDAVEIVLVEASTALRTAQAAALAPLGKTPRWARELSEIEADRPLFLIANEFFDALPIRQFVKTERGWCERMVGLDARGALAFTLSPVALPVGRVPANRDGAPPGGFYETAPAGDALAEEIGHRIARRGGAALVIDYGYDVPGFGETLQAVARHAFADILRDPGASDLTAHVDFGALRDAAGRGGARVHGPIGQGTFLRRLGIDARAERLGAQADRDRLVAPEQMGTLFQALAIVPRDATPPAGF
ncbi:MAG TPA: SAM-dependent methyltransferase [Rhizomicrobium sp.]